MDAFAGLQMFRKQICRVVISANFYQLDSPVADSLLDPQALCVDMAQFAQTLCANVLALIEAIQGAAVHMEVASTPRSGGAGVEEEHSGGAGWRDCARTEARVGATRGGAGLEAEHCGGAGLRDSARPEARVSATLGGASIEYEHSGS